MFLFAEASFRVFFPSLSNAPQKKKNKEKAKETKVQGRMDRVYVREEH